MHTAATNLRADSRARSAAAFALAELLVVVAIITILVAVLVPVAVQARNRARSAYCLSNLRQISAALIAYSHDWNDRLPKLEGTAFAGSAGSLQWPEGSSATLLREVTRRYVTSAETYHCRNDFGAPEFGFSSSGGSVFARAGSSYLPWSSARTGTYGLALNGSRISGRPSSTRCCLVRDYGSDWHGYGERSGLDVEVTTVANGAYADGHAAPVAILSVTISGRSYVCYPTVDGGVLFISGGSGDVRAELSGRSSLETTPSGQQRRQLWLSGTVSGGGSTTNVDRVFSFGHQQRLDGAFRQIVAWVDGLVVQ